VLTSVEGSIQLAESMEARAFGSGRRTSMETTALHSGDWLLIGTSLAAALLFLAAQTAGRLADWAPYPSLQPPGLDALPLLGCLLLFMPAVTWRSRG
jgi:hypothetical protein